MRLGKKESRITPKCSVLLTWLMKISGEKQCGAVRLLEHTKFKEPESLGWGVLWYLGSAKRCVLELKTQQRRDGS